MEINNVLEVIRRILDSDISDDTFHRLTSLEYTLKDAVSYNFPQFNLQQDYLNRDWSTFEGYILNGLGHLSANPSDQDRANILEKAYVYLSEVDNNEKWKIYPNYSESTSKEFIDELIKLSWEEKIQYRKKTKGPRNIFILSGERGLGKTIYINHLLTKYNSYLNKNKVIWVRLDLSLNYGTEKPEVRDLFLSKLVKIIFTYYLDLPEFANLISELKKYFNKDRYNDAEIRLKFHENIQILYNKFHEKKGSRKITTNLIYKDVAEQVLDYAIKADYSFLFILDNFDKLDITPYHSAKFTHYFHQLDTITDPDDRSGAALLVVTRNDTRIYLEQNASPSVSKRNNRVKEVKGIEFSRIIKRRLEYLKRNVSKIAYHTNYDINRITNHLNSFEEYVLTTAENKQIEQYITNMDLLYGENNRIKVQLLQLLYHNYLDVRNSRYKYRLIEAMCKAGYSFPPRIYSYRFNNGDLIPVSHNKIFDNVFMPLIFSYPYVDDKNRINIPASKTYIMMGLRLIQLIQAFSRFNESSSLITSFSLRTFNILLNKLYGYDPKIINALIEEYSDYGLLKLKGDNILISRNYNSLEIIAMPKVNLLFGSFRTLLNNNQSLGQSYEFPIYGNILADVAYLNMCAYRLSINEVALSNKVPFINTILLQEEKLNTISQWVIWKIINSLSMYLLIKKGLGIEDQHIDLSKLSSDEQKIYSNINRIRSDELAIQLENQYQRILYEMNTEELEQLSNFLNNYINLWIN